MKQRVIIEHPREFAGEVGSILTDEYSDQHPEMLHIRMDRGRCSAMFHRSEVRLLPAGYEL
jgi:hypothetical protein